MNVSQTGDGIRRRPNGDVPPMNWLKKVVARTRAQVARVVAQYALSDRDRDFLAAHSPNPSNGSGDAVIAIESVEDYFFLCLFGWVVATLRQHGLPLSAQQFVPRSLRPSASRTPLWLAKGLIFQNRMTDRKWMRLYAAYCDRVAYRSAGIGFSLDEVRDFAMAYRLWRGLKNKEDLLAVELHGVAVGDLVYDSYLRFKPAATVRLRDVYLLLVIWQAARDVRRAKHYFGTTRPKVFLTSYSTYIQHGVAVRVALSHGVRVFSFGNYQEFSKELNLADWVHTRNPDRYREIFATLDARSNKLAEADARLAARVAGRLDNATAYMRQSAYAGSDEPLPDVRGGMVVFLHDFFDSPHCYRWMLFPDFWEWASKTLQIASRAGVRVFVKPHPNQIELSAAVVKTLRELHPQVEFLPARVSNKQLADAGIACAVTVYGTVAHEMAYLGVPSIGSAHHPHISFDFCQTARSVSEYEQLLLAPHDSRHSSSKEELRRQSLEFYYMHNLYLPERLLGLRDQVAQFRSRIGQAGHRFIDKHEYLGATAAVRAQPAFVEFCDHLAGVLWKAT